jgi:DNA-binding XRE family transcriptional regulator
MQSTLTRVSAEELRRLGVQVTVSGDLARFRAKTRLTKNTMAHLLGVSIGALSAYEKAERAITKDVALRIGEWYWGACLALKDALSSGIPVHTMIPIAQAAQHLNIPVDEVFERCRAGILRCESLGVMGHYVYADDLPGPVAERIANGRTPIKA